MYAQPVRYSLSSAENSFWLLNERPKKIDGVVCRLVVRSFVRSLFVGGFGGRWWSSLVVVGRCRLLWLLLLFRLLIDDECIAIVS